MASISWNARVSDADYRGELKALLINHGKDPFTIERGMRIAQLIISKFESVFGLKPRNKEQAFSLDLLFDPQVKLLTLVGLSGSGKTLLALAAALEQLKGIGNPDVAHYSKLIVTKPVQPVGKDIGFLPGTLNQKMEPWTRPIFDVFSEYFHAKEIQTMITEGVIEVSPLAYMRGRTFKNAFILADEMQNATVNQMKMLLTRLGEGSKMVVTGDLAQADRLNDNGLINFCDLIVNRDLQYIDIVQFDHKDIERHNAVKEVLSVYGD